MKAFSRTLVRGKAFSRTLVRGKQSAWLSCLAQRWGASPPLPPVIGTDKE